jgi:hypothetical protein
VDAARASQSSSLRLFPSACNLVRYLRCGRILAILPGESLERYTRPLRYERILIMLPGESSKQRLTFSSVSNVDATKAPQSSSLRLLYEASSLVRFSRCGRIIARPSGGMLHQEISMACSPMSPALESTCESVSTSFLFILQPLRFNSCKSRCHRNQTKECAVCVCLSYFYRGHRGLF